MSFSASDHAAAVFLLTHEFDQEGAPATPPTAVMPRKYTPVPEGIGLSKIRKHIETHGAASVDPDHLPAILNRFRNSSVPATDDREFVHATETAHAISHHGAESALAEHKDVPRVAQLMRKFGYPEHQAASDFHNAREQAAAAAKATAAPPAPVVAPTPAKPAVYDEPYHARGHEDKSLRAKAISRMLSHADPSVAAVLAKHGALDPGEAKDVKRRQESAYEDLHKARVAAQRAAAGETSSPTPPATAPAAESPPAADTSQPPSAESPPAEQPQSPPPTATADPSAWVEKGHVDRIAKMNAWAKSPEVQALLKQNGVTATNVKSDEGKATSHRLFDEAHGRPQSAATPGQPSALSDEEMQRAREEFAEKKKRADASTPPQQGRPVTELDTHRRIIDYMRATGQHAEADAMQADLDEKLAPKPEKTAKPISPYHPPRSSGHGSAMKEFYHHPDAKPFLDYHGVGEHGNDDVNNARWLDAYQDFHGKRFSDRQQISVNGKRHDIDPPRGRMPRPGETPPAPVVSYDDVADEPAKPTAWDRIRSSVAQGASAAGRAIGSGATAAAKGIAQAAGNVRENGLKNSLESGVYNAAEGIANFPMTAAQSLLSRFRRPATESRANSSGDAYVPYDHPDRVATMVEWMQSPANEQKMRDRGVSEETIKSPNGLSHAHRVYDELRRDEHLNGVPNPSPTHDESATAPSAEIPESIHERNTRWAKSIIGGTGKIPVSEFQRIRDSLMKTGHGKAAIALTARYSRAADDATHFSRPEIEAMHWLLAHEFSGGIQKTIKWEPEDAHQEDSAISDRDKKMLRYHVGMIAGSDRKSGSRRAGFGFNDGDRVNGLAMSRYNEHATEDSHREIASVLSRHLSQVPKRDHDKIQTIAAYWQGQKPDENAQAEDIHAALIRNAGKRPLILDGDTQRNLSLIKRLKETGAQPRYYSGRWNVHHDLADKSKLSQYLGWLHDRGVYSFSRDDDTTEAVKFLLEHEFGRLRPARGQGSFDWDADKHPRLTAETAKTLEHRHAGEFAKLPDAPVAATLPKPAASVDSTRSKTAKPSPEVTKTRNGFKVKIGSTIFTVKGSRTPEDAIRSAKYFQKHGTQMPVSTTPEPLNGGYDASSGAGKPLEEMTTSEAESSLKSFQTDGGYDRFYFGNFRNPATETTTFPSREAAMSSHEYVSERAAKRSAPRNSPTAEPPQPTADVDSAPAYQTANDISDKIAASRGLLHNIGRSYGLRDDDLDDFISDAQLTALRFKDGYDPARGAFSTWLSTVGHSVAGKNHDKVRRRNSHALTTSLDAPLSTDGGSLLSTLPGKADGGTDSQATARLHEAIDSLPENQRDLVRAVFFEGRSASDIAKVRGVSKQAISAAMGKATDTLRRKLGKDFEFSRDLADVCDVFGVSYSAA